MSEFVELKASVRERVGKGAARAERREGLVPAVIYGDNKAPEAITLPYKEVYKQLHTGQFLATVFEIDVNGKKSQVLARDCQVHPVKDFPMHVDFLRIGKGTKVSVSVAVSFLNEDTCPGLKKGGALNVVRHELELTCAPNAIPEVIEIDLAEADIGSSIHISDVTLPEGVTSTITDRDFTVATIASSGPTEAEEDEAAAEAAAAEAEEGDGEEAASE